MQVAEGVAPGPAEQYILDSLLLRYMPNFFQKTCPDLFKVLHEGEKTTYKLPQAKKKCEGLTADNTRVGKTIANEAVKRKAKLVTEKVVPLDGSLCMTWTSTYPISR